MDWLKIGWCTTFIKTLALYLPLRCIYVSKKNSGGLSSRMYLNNIIYILFDGFTYNTRGYFASCVVFFRAPKGRGKLRAMSNEHFVFWLLCFGNSFEIHPALTVHRYMARTNGVNNTERS